MRSAPKMAIAASLMVCAIGVPATIHYLQNYSGELPVTKVATNNQPSKPPFAVLPGGSVPAEQQQALNSILSQTPLTGNLVAPPPANNSQQMAAAVVAGRSEQADERRVRMLNMQSAQVASPSAVRDLERGPRIQAAPVVGLPERKSSEAVILPRQDEGRDRFADVPANPVKSVLSEPVSTFSIDVDTASYSFVRRAISSGRLPQKNAVRIEEMVNYFSYEYPLPKDASRPFEPTVTLMPSPWNPTNQLLHIAIKGYDVLPAQRPRANLVFLIDTSGSMAPEDRLPLLKNSFKLLVDTLKPDDTIGIVTYAGNSAVALEPTKVSDKGKIIAAIDRLQAGGSTAGGAGIADAYRLAESAFDKAAVNRIVLGTDGDFNVGITNREELKNFVERKRESGIFLSILGVGRGNYNDALMQSLAQNGNGTAAYIDTLNEARKVLAEESSSILFPIAKDVKIQVEFNPSAVSEYRLVGYETRSLRREDFNNDKVDAGEIGSGHSVTAIYELTPVGAPKAVDDLRYSKSKSEMRPAALNEPAPEVAFVKLRYKLPKEDDSKLIELPVRAGDQKQVSQASADVRFSTAVAAFGQLLRGDPYLKKFGYDDVIALANGARGEDKFGYRGEFVNLARLAKLIKP